MKNVVKYASYLLAVIVAALTAVIIYVKVALPNVGEAEVIKIEYTPDRIERGRYLATSVSICMDCHSTRDFTKFSGPPKDGTFGMGGDRFDQSVGMPGVFFAKNITPAGIIRYTDGELYRTITTGVSKEGKALFPLMPFRYYGRMDREDIYDIIAYIRSIPALENDVPLSKPDFPVNIIINTMPRKEIPQAKPPKSDILAYGAYMTNASGCAECHTKDNKGQIIEEVKYAGGREFKFPDGTTVRSANITSDPETGLGKWTEEMFLKRFKIYADSSYKPEGVAPGEFNSIMPWTMYAKMNDEDLTAIYAYLKTIEPISNKVVKFTGIK